MIRVAHIITGLDTGGAEMMLSRLVSSLDPTRFASTVISLSSKGEIARRIESSHVPVTALGLRANLGALGGLSALLLTLRKFKPDVIQTWLYHADLLGGIAGALLRRPVVWNIRQSSLEPELLGARTALLMRGLARVSGVLPFAIVCGSDAAREAHLKLGYAREKMVVIPNGLRTDLLGPSPEARLSVRNELGIPLAAPVIGIVARYDVFKDHRTFTKVAGVVQRGSPGCHFILCGRGVTDANVELMAWLREEGVAARAHLLGERKDVPRILAALDVLLSTSKAEGFPNVIAEALACGIPCVATDAGDSRRIIGDCGTVVPVGDVAGLAREVVSLLSLPVARLAQVSEAATSRARTHFDIRAIAARYEELYAAVSARAWPPAAHRSNQV